MAWVGLKVVPLVSMLIHNFSSSAALSAPKCISQGELEDRANKLQRIYWRRQAIGTELRAAGRSCRQTAAQLPGGGLNNRSVSPWSYRLDQDVDRIPHEIARAECLCQGCIINQQEDLRYNSVPVFAHLKVLRKSRCPSDIKKYLVKKEFIKVAVACTCVAPKYRLS